MMTKRPQWWQLYMLGAMMVILLLATHFAFIDAAARHLAQIGIILIGYGLILAWLRSQTRAIECEEWADIHRDEVTRDHELSTTGQPAFYHFVLSRRDAGANKQGEGRW